MAQPDPAKTTTNATDHPAEVVYRRTEPGAAERNAAASLDQLRARTREIAPAITPLVIGFTLLLVLIFVLGQLSVQRMADVSSQVYELEKRQTVRLRLLLDIKLAVTQLNNEARARHEAESGIRPPFNLRFDEAQGEVDKLLLRLEQPPLNENSLWNDVSRDLRKYVAVTEDQRRYSLVGFATFREFDRKIDNLIKAWYAQQTEISRQRDEIEKSAVRSIRSWSVVALLVGFLVAGGTVWEVQRRFKQMRSSMLEAGRERAFTNQLLEGMVSAVAAVDEADRLRSANAAFFKIFPRASIGASIHEKFAPDDATKMLQAATATRASTATYRGRWVCGSVITHDEKTFDVYSSPLAINGDQGQIITLVDATEAAEAERGLRRSESLAMVGQATAQVAHEIRNPLGSIRLGVSMLRDGISDPDALNTIELVERGISHLNKLVVDVTQFSRQKELDRSRVDLHELLDVSLDLVSESVLEKQTPIEKKLSEESMVGNWDGHQLRQVFVNLISNAIEASAAQSPVKISTALVKLTGVDDGDEKRFARVTVADEGRGINPTTINRIFEPFYSTKKRGTGLGLAIVRQIVEQHGGRIAVDSEVGRGTRFVVDLPL